MKSNFNLDDVKNYLLDKMPEDDRRKFEEALDADEELRDMLKTLESDAGMIDRNTGHSINSDDDDIIFNRLKRLETRPAVRAGQVWTLEEPGVKVLIMDDPVSPAGESEVRIVPMTENVNYKTAYDLSCSDKNIMFREAVFHMHLLSVMLTSELKGFVTALEEDIFKRLKDAEERILKEAPQEEELCRSLEGANENAFKQWRNNFLLKLESLRKKVFRNIYRENSPLYSSSADIVIFITFDESGSDDFRVSEQRVTYSGFNFDVKEIVENEYSVKYNFMDRKKVALYYDERFVVNFIDKGSEQFFEVINPGCVPAILNDLSIHFGSEKVFDKREIRTVNGIAEVPVTVNIKPSKDFYKTIRLKFEAKDEMFNEEFALKVKISYSSK